MSRSLEGRTRSAAVRPCAISYTMQRAVLQQGQQPRNAEQEQGVQDRGKGIDLDL
jgi:hypothetical protein